MTSLFRQFASSTSNGRTARVMRICMVCGACTTSMVEVNSFNEWSFQREHLGTGGYVGQEFFRHVECIKSGQADYSFLDKKVA